ncbi:MAG: hypothetical protein H6735_00540 [Alphaproteobacteria bacterium]|nr:hypothetical protein [Alphaproteobacteria bacterium]
MPVVGAVLHLRPGLEPPTELDDPRITVGERNGDKLPIVVVTDHRREDRQLLEQLEASPHVHAVFVAFVDHSDLVEVSP